MYRPFPINRTQRILSYWYWDCIIIEMTTKMITRQRSPFPILLLVYADSVELVVELHYLYDSVLYTTIHTVYQSILLCKARMFGKPKSSFRCHMERTRERIWFLWCMMTTSSASVIWGSANYYYVDDCTDCTTCYSKVDCKF